MCSECQELNALHSSVVDGGSIKIPERLLKVPERQEGEDVPRFVLDVLHEEAVRFTEELQQTLGVGDEQLEIGEEEAEQNIVTLLSSSKMAVSEYELVMHAASIARKHNIDLTRFTAHIDFGALTTAEKYAVSVQLNLDPEQHPYIWNRYAPNS